MYTIEVVRYICNCSVLWYFCRMNLSSKLLENAVNEMAQFPGIGKRTALRLVLHLLKQPKNHTHQLTQSLNNLVNQINHCKVCHNLSDHEICEICANPLRNKKVIQKEIID